MEGPTKGLVVVAGGTGTIGAAICRDLTAWGVDVVAVSRTGGMADEHIEDVHCDLSTTDDVARLVRDLGQRPQGVRGLVTCLPSGLPRIGVREQSVDIALVEELFPLLSKNGGSVVMISSTAARQPFATGHARFYAAEKAAVEGYVRAAARELSPMRINALAPGVVEGPCAPGGVHEKIDLRQVPIGRFVKAEEIGRWVGYLLLGPAVMTGQVLTVDGGVTACLPLGA